MEARLKKAELSYGAATRCNAHVQQACRSRTSTDNVRTGCLAVLRLRLRLCWVAANVCVVGRGFDVHICPSEHLLSLISPEKNG